MKRLTQIVFLLTAISCCLYNGLVKNVQSVYGESPKMSKPHVSETNPEVRKMLKDLAKRLNKGETEKALAFFLPSDQNTQAINAWDEETRKNFAKALLSAKLLKIRSEQSRTYEISLDVNEGGHKKKMTFPLEIEYIPALGRWVIVSR